MKWAEVQPWSRDGSKQIVYTGPLWLSDNEGRRFSFVQKEAQQGEEQ